MLQVKNSLVNSLIGGTALDVISKTSITNANCVNCLSPIFVTSTGSNNISSDTSAATLGIGTQDALLNTYFTDPANNDYTINTVGQAALKTKGWNGTDLVSWAYATVAPIIAAALSGTITSPTTEVDIVQGGKTIILTLTNDTWQTSGTAFDAQRQAIINGFVSAQTELTGWNNEVQAKELVSSVVRTSNNIVTITLAAALLYNINSNEIITPTIPASALITSTTPVATDLNFTITPTISGFIIAWAMNSVQNQLIT